MLFVFLYVIVCDMACSGYEIEDFSFISFCTFYKYTLQLKLDWTDDWFLI